MLSSISNILLLLVIASLGHHLSKRIKIPYTILLFVIGVCIALLSHSLDMQFLTLELTPELLFFVFLPVLIFESGYSIKYHELAKNYVTIRTLAIFGVLISTVTIGVGGRWLLSLIGFDIPLVLMLLFGIIISSTDPVAVLAIFKDMGVPKRLRLLFEGESLFNDGTSLALFLVLLELINAQTFSSQTLLSGIGSFSMMVIGGIILGVVVGILFSVLIQYIKNNEPAEITLTMVLAHLTFVLAEYITYHVTIGGIDIQISGVIATAYAALILGNYGKTKISPKVEEYMEKFRSFFSFVCNSLVFLLMGLLVPSIILPGMSIIPVVLICVVTVVIARGVSVYLPVGLLNISRVHESIPMTRQHLMARGSLRGALAIVLVLLIPEGFAVPGWTHSYDPQTFLLLLTISVVMFSLVVKGLTIKPIIKRLNMDKLYDLEEFEQYESEIIVYDKITQKIQQMKQEYNISQHTYDILLEKYRSKMEESKLKMQVFLEQQPNSEELIFKAISLHALGIEKQYLKEMYMYNEMSENLFHYLLAKIDTQITRVTSAESQIRGFDKPEYMKKRFRDPIIRLIHLLQHTNYCTHDAYIINRTRVIVTSKVIEGLQQFSQIDFGYHSDTIDNVSDLYKKFNARAHDEIEKLKAENDKEIECIDSVLLNKGLAKTEEHVIHDLLHKDMITDKLYLKFMEEIEEEILKAY